MKSESVFRKHKNTLREISLPVLSTGRDHHGISARFETLMTLADRLLVSASETPEHGDLSRRISVNFDSIGQKPSAGSDILRDSLEGWLKLVLHRADPKRYASIRQSRMFNAHQAILDLA